MVLVVVLRTMRCMSCGGCSDMSLMTNGGRRCLFRVWPPVMVVGYCFGDDQIAMALEVLLKNARDLAVLARVRTWDYYISAMIEGR